MYDRTISPRAFRVAVVLAALALLLPLLPARAASSVSIEARPLLGGRYEVGGWTAIAVTLVNEGQPTEGHLTAETRTGDMRRFVEMPAGARKAVTLYVQPDAFQRRITVRYEEANGAVEAEVELRVLDQTGGQVAVVGDGAGNVRPQLSAIEDGRAEPLDLGIGDLPERPEPLEALSGMIWAADSTALSDAQRRSLERWVADGGQLVVLGGADWQARTESFADLLPIEGLTAADGVAQAGLAGWTGVDDAPIAEATVTTGSLRPDARMLIEGDDGTPLLSMRPIGAGRVVLVGPDLATEAHRGWAGAPILWSRLLPSSAAIEQFWGGPGFPAREEAENSMSQALGNVPSLEVPPAELLLGVIVAYILLIGPITYVVLRRLDRRELAWITAPVLVVLFSACSYGIGTSLKGGDIIVNQISLIHSSSAGRTATVQAYAGIFSPERTTFDLSVDADALMAQLRPSNGMGGQRAPVSNVVAHQGDPARLEGLSIGVFGFEGVRADAVVDYEPALNVTWAYEDGALTGTVTNDGDEPLADVAFISGSGGTRVGDLEPGEEKSFEVRRNMNGSSASDSVYGFGGFDGNGDGERVALLRRQVIDSLVGYGGFMPGMDIGAFSGRGPYLIGWRQTPGPLPVAIDGLEAQRLDHSVEVIAVRPQLATGETTIGPGQMVMSVVDRTGDASEAGPGMMMIGDGSATFSIALPLEASGMEVTELEILTGPDPGMVIGEGGDFGGMWPPGYTIELRDPETDEWEMLGDLSQDSRFEVEDPSTALDEAGRIEVRVTGEGINPNFGANTIFVSARATGVIGE